MKTALFIGGTGTISTAITRLLSTDNEWKLYLLNRGNRKDIVPNNVEQIIVDINDENEVNEKLKGMTFDVVCDFIGFTLPQVERDYRLFRNKTSQYMYISSASAYQKPCTNHIITEKTPLANPYWQYSRDKIECESFLMNKYREEQFPVTIIRPSQTYDERNVPLSVCGDSGWPVVRRMMKGKPVIIHGDGSSLWTHTHNSDFAKGFVGLMANKQAIGEAIQITSDESLTWYQIYNEVAKAIGVELHPYYVSSTLLAEVGKQYGFEGRLLGDHACTVIFDNSKLKTLVPSFRATTPFAKGIRQTIEHILSHPELQKEDKEFDTWCDNLINQLDSVAKNMK